uniref:Uncharacterized protein n=1 Tax=Bird gammacoronavirus CharadriusCN24 TaxID=3237965 RepID=A0AB39AFR2_9GAMC
MSHSTLKSDSSITKTSASLKKDYLKEKRAASLSRMKLVVFPDVVVTGPGGSWSYPSFDFEPSVDDYTLVCSDKPLTKPE